MREAELPALALGGCFGGFVASLAMNWQDPMLAVVIAPLAAIAGFVGAASSGAVYNAIVRWRR